MVVLSIVNMSNTTITWAGSITSNRSNKLAITVNHKRDRKMNRNIGRGIIFVILRVIVWLMVIV